MSIGTRIIQLRNQKGLTQQQLSDLHGLGGLLPFAHRESPLGT